MRKITLAVLMLLGLLFVVSCGDDDEDEDTSCTLAEAVCDGNTFKVCIAKDGATAATDTEWYSVDCSASGKTCDVALGGCTGGTTTCTEGAKQCSGTKIQTCTGGTWVDGTDCSATSQTCEAGACTGGTTTCTEGAKQCSGTKVQICQNNAWVDSVDCATNSQTCEAGACKDASTTGYPNGLKITGTINLYHPTAIPDGQGGFQDASSQITACDPEGTVPASGPYGTLTVNANFAEVATESPSSIDPSAAYAMQTSPYTGTMGTVSLPAVSQNVAIAYQGVYNGSNYVGIDNFGVNGSSIDYSYFMTMSCDEPISNSVSVGPFQDNVCQFAVLKIEGSNIACYYALGVAYSDVNDGSSNLTVTK